MNILRAGISLTLLIDVFASASPPRSRAILTDEAADLSWVPVRAAAA